MFDFFKVQDGKPVFLDDYLQRFYESARLMDMAVPLSEKKLKEVIAQLIQLNQLPLSGVKMILTGGYSPNGYDLAAPNLIMMQQGFSLPNRATVEEGIKIITHEYVREIPVAKTINYTVGIRLQKEIKAQGADDVLYHQQGTVTEFPRCNFFIVKQDNTVVTPAKDVLLGITRKRTLELASQQYPVVEGPVTLEDIYQAKEAFLTSTTKRILPIVQVNGRAIGDGKSGTVTLDLLDRLIAQEEQQVSRTA